MREQIDDSLEFCLEHPPTSVLTLLQLIQQTWFVSGMLRDFAQFCQAAVVKIHERTVMQNGLPKPAIKPVSRGRLENVLRMASFYIGFE